MKVGTRLIRDDALFVIDGSGYIFRAYFAVRPLSSSKGIPTNAVYGFTSMLLKLLKEHRPHYVAMAFDTGKPSFRKKIYEGYKAHRPPPPPDLVPQFEWIQKVVDAFNIRRLSMEGFEADDIIGTLARMAHEEGRQVIIVTGDKDMMQLVNGDIWLLDELRAAKSGTEELIDRQGVIDKFGVTPEQIVDVLALMGDASDNVPGIKGIGEKTAVELIKEYGSLESIINAAPLMKQKARRERILEGIRDARMSKELVTIDRHCPVNLHVSDLQYQGPDLASVQTIFHELDFKRLLQDPYFGLTGSLSPVLSQDVSDKPALDRSRYACITDEAALRDIAHKLSKADRIAIDTETNGLDDMQCALVGISLAWGENEAAYIPISHLAQSAQLPLELVCRILNPILTQPGRIIVGQNAKFDQKVLLRHGFSEFQIGSDTMLASYVLDADSEKHNLDELSRRYLHHNMLTYEEVCGTGRQKKTFDEIDLPTATAYSAEDADATLRLSLLLEKRLVEEQLDRLYHDLELPLETVLMHMEVAGMKIDVSRLKQMSDEFGVEIESLEKQAHELAGGVFNLASPKQVGEVLFEKLGLEAIKKTKTGYSTDSDVLEALAVQHPLPRLLLQHRMLSKLKGTYVDALPALVNPVTGRVHTSFNQAITATGRLSSSDPNLQNIPVRGPFGRRIREAFIAEAGNVLISLDYSQVELRILAHVSQDPVMLDAFIKGEDVHQRTASEIFAVPLAEVTKEQRNMAKTINFGLMYGMGVHKLSQTLGITRTQASAYLARYYERYAGIFNWQKSALEKAKETKEVVTLFGRRRKVPDIVANNRMLAQRAERIAINTPIQGTAADMMKKAMLDVDALLRLEHPSAKMVLQVHDELVIEVPKQEAQIVADKVKSVMTNSTHLLVPMVVEAGIGHSWGEAH